MDVTFTAKRGAGGGEKQRARGVDSRVYRNRYIDGDIDAVKHDALTRLSRNVSHTVLAHPDHKRFLSD